MGEDDMKELLASGDLDNHLFNRSSAPLKAPIRRVSAPNPPGTPHDFALALPPTTLRIMCEMLALNAKSCHGINETAGQMRLQPPATVPKPVSNQNA
jgi:hypothetical protein